MALDINLKDFYDYSKIELHFFTFDVNTFDTCDISYLTHPDLSLITAIQMSCALPILVTPICTEEKCYIDGGITCNYPIKYCIDSGKKIEDILGFKNKYEDYNKNRINSSSTLLEFIMNFLFKIILSISSSSKPQIPINFEVISNTDFLSISTLKSALYSIEVREKLYKNGIETAKIFISNLENTI